MTHSRIVEFSKYLLKPLMREGESLIGYILRVCSDNNIEKERLLVNLLSVVYREKQESVLTPFNQVLRVIGDKNTLDLDWYTHKRYEIAKRHPKAIEWKMFSTNHMRFCPECIRKDGYHFHCWTLPLFSACPIHYKQLITRCSCCNSNLNWRYIRHRWGCKCGSSIKDMRAGAANEWQLTQAIILIHALDLPLSKPYQAMTNMQGKWGAYSLINVYVAIYSASLIRQTLKSGLNCPHHSEKPFVIDRARYKKMGAWEVALMFDEHKQTQRIQRLFKLRVQKKNDIESIITFNKVFEILTQVILNDIEQQNPFNITLREVFLSVSKQHHIPTLFEELREYFGRFNHVEFR